MDLDFLSFLADHRSEFLTKIFSAFTFLGSEYAAIGVVCLVYWCCNRKMGNRMLLTVLSSLMLNQLLKILFIARRPWIRDAQKVRTVESAKADATGYAFPSGHTSNATAILGGLVYGRRVKLIWKILAWVIVALVGFSRLYLGVHTPQDVIVGVLLSLALIYLMGRVSEKLDEKPSLDIFICIVTTILAVTTLLITLLRSFPADHLAEDIAKNKQDVFKLAGASVGMVLGWVLERRLVGFDKPMKMLFGVVRFVVGIVLVLGIMILTKSPLIALIGSESWAGVVRYFLCCFVAIFVWPLCFTSLEKKIALSYIKD